jgi:hypothetical protein
MQSTFNNGSVFLHASGDGEKKMSAEQIVRDFLSAFSPGAPDILPTGKKFAIADTFVFTVMGDQITAVYVDSPPNGGLAGMLQQLGIQLPTQ